MIFNKNLITHLPPLKQVEIDGVRFYTAEGVGPYPSVTTVLSADKEKQKSLDSWRRRVGDDVANMVSHQAAQRGTDVHIMMEDYILGQETTKKMMPNIKELFMGLKRFADVYIDNIMMVEGQLFSHHLRVAGTVDLVAEFDGKIAIIDWKTAAKPKKREYITNYFMQEAAYAVMFEERTGIPVEKLVTLVAYPEGTQMFVEYRDEWIGKFMELREMYDKELQSNLSSACTGAELRDQRGVL